MKVCVYFVGHYLMDMADLSILNRAISVEQKYKNSEYHYYPSDSKPTLAFVSPEQIHLEEEDNLKNLKEKLSEKENESSKNWRKAYDLEQKNKDLENKLKALESLCPHPKPEENKEEVTTEE